MAVILNLVVPISAADYFRTQFRGLFSAFIVKQPCAK